MRSLRVEAKTTKRLLIIDIIVIYSVVFTRKRKHIFVQKTATTYFNIIGIHTVILKLF